MRCESADDAPVRLYIGPSENENDGLRWMHWGKEKVGKLEMVCAMPLDKSRGV